MRNLWVSVERVIGRCTGVAPMRCGVGFAVRDGRICAPGGGPICLFALQALLPLLPAKERHRPAADDKDWLGRVHHVQCPDPKGRVVWRIDASSPGGCEQVPLPAPQSGDLMVRVEEVGGVCTSGMRPGHAVLVRDSGVYFSQPFCLYALAATLPLLPAMARELPPGDWMAHENAVICPDPKGNVLLRIERLDR